MKNRYKVGDAVRARRDHGLVRRGQVGQVTEVRRGFYYGVAWPGVGPIYSPEEYVADKDDASGDGDADDTGTGGTAPQPAAASAWERLMDLLKRHADDLT